MQSMLKHSAAAAGLVLSLAAAGLAHAATTTVKIVAFNDFHGNLNSPGTFSGAPSGGVDYLAGYIANLKSQNPNTVVVEAGDVIGASPLVSAFYHDEGTIETLNRAGLNIASVGNHEFDEGSTELLRMQNGGCHPTDPNSCKGASVNTPVPFEGAKFKYSSANVTVDATGRSLFPPYVIKTFNGVRVGFIGMTLKDTPTIVSPSGVAGLTFSDGDLIADAQLAATAPAANGGAVVAFMNAGGVRAPGFTATSYPHDVTYSEAFAVQPFGNGLVTMTLTAQQIKNALEQQFVGCLGQTTQRIMQISNGFSYSWSASAAPCSKIVDVTLNGTQLVSGGVVLSPGTTYSIACNNFMSTGGDGFTVFTGGTNPVVGAQDIDALVAYLSNFLSPNPPYDPTSPVLHKPRITKVL